MRDSMTSKATRVFRAGEGLYVDCPVTMFSKTGYLNKLGGVGFDQN